MFGTYVYDLFLRRVLTPVFTQHYLDTTSLCAAWFAEADDSKQVLRLATTLLSDRYDTQ